MQENRCKACRACLQLSINGDFCFGCCRCDNCPPLVLHPPRNHLYFCTWKNDFSLEFCSNPSDLLSPGNNREPPWHSLVSRRGELVDVLSTRILSCQMYLIVPPQPLMTHFSFSSLLVFVHQKQNHPHPLIAFFLSLGCLFWFE